MKLDIYRFTEEEKKVLIHVLDTFLFEHINGNTEEEDIKIIKEFKNNLKQVV